MCSSTWCTVSSNLVISLNCNNHLEAGPRSLADRRVDSYSIRFYTAVVRAELGLHVGKASSAYGWSSGFPRVLQFSPTFDERSARYKWKIFERAVKSK